MQASYTTVYGQGDDYLPYLGLMIYEYLITTNHKYQITGHDGGKEKYSWKVTLVAEHTRVEQN